MRALGGKPLYRSRSGNRECVRGKSRCTHQQKGQRNRPGHESRAMYSQVDTAQPRGISKHCVQAIEQRLAQATHLT